MVMNSFALRNSFVSGYQHCLVVVGSLHADFVSAIRDPPSGTNRQRPPLFSFLTRFYRAKPYPAAFERGVKLIGAPATTSASSWTTGQSSSRTSLAYLAATRYTTLSRRGATWNALCSSRAVRWHLERRILFYGNKMVVFD